MHGPAAGPAVQRVFMSVGRGINITHLACAGAKQAGHLATGQPLGAATPPRHPTGAPRPRVLTDGAGGGSPRRPPRPAGRTPAAFAHTSRRPRGARLSPACTRRRACALLLPGPGRTMRPAPGAPCFDPTPACARRPVARSPSRRPCSALPRAASTAPPRPSGRATPYPRALPIGTACHRHGAGAPTPTPGLTQGAHPTAIQRAPPGRCAHGFRAGGRALPSFAFRCSGNARPCRARLAPRVPGGRLSYCESRQAREEGIQYHTCTFRTTQARTHPCAQTRANFARLLMPLRALCPSCRLPRRPGRRPRQASRGRGPAAPATQPCPAAAARPQLDAPAGRRCAARRPASFAPSGHRPPHVPQSRERLTGLSLPAPGHRTAAAPVHSIRTPFPRPQHCAAPRRRRRRRRKRRRPMRAGPTPAPRRPTPTRARPPTRHP